MDAGSKQHNVKWHGKCHLCFSELLEATERTETLVRHTKATPASSCIAKQHLPSSHEFLRALLHPPPPTTPLSHDGHEPFEVVPEHTEKEPLIPLLPGQGIRQAAHSAQKGIVE